MFPALAWSVKSEPMPDESPAKHRFIHFKGLYFFNQKRHEFPDSRLSLAAPNCPTADVAVFPGICLEKVANA